MYYLNIRLKKKKQLVPLHRHTGGKLNVMMHTFTVMFCFHVEFYRMSTVIYPITFEIVLQNILKANTSANFFFQFFSVFGGCML